MRHRKSRLRLRQKPAHSRLMQRNMVTSLLLYETIRTTKKRAEVIRPIVDKLITLSKKKDPHNAIRQINRFVTDKNACRKTMEVFKARYAARTSGFTRMTPLGSRRGDGAELVTLALIDAQVGAVAAVATPDEKNKKIKRSKRTEKKSDSSSSSQSSVSSSSSESSLSS